MWKLFYILAPIAILVALYEMGTESPNVVVTSICVVVFMVAMMRLSSKTKSKNQEDDQSSDQ